MPYDDAGWGILPGTTGQNDPVQGATGTVGLAIGTGTGQYGAVNYDVLAMQSSITSFWSWLTRPLTTPLSLWQLMEIAIALGAGWFLWTLLMFHIRIAAEEIG